MYFNICETSLESKIYNVTFLYPFGGHSSRESVRWLLHRSTRIGITVLKIVIWGGKSSVLWSEISFYGDAQRSRKTQFATIKPMIYLPK